MVDTNKPNIFILSGNLGENGRRFIQNFEIYMIALKKPSGIKAAILLNLVREETVEIFKTFNLLDENRMKYKVHKMFESYFQLRKNMPYERFLLYLRNQE
ncbi:hypothetical protein PR048_014137 [Dryococelus australis]|uniref:LAGLIDADG homing endonuclease n=1 Tax=Dryococelus australis TaxID=614101 RepID=A0ABQ9HDI9_9NEOP|nr:hypothetical protein PR048_014137 [Dryococelus australis]